MRVNPRMSENITLASTCLPPSARPGRQELLGHLGGRELPEQLALLVPEPLLLEARADARPEQHRVHRLEEVVLGAHLDAPGDAVHLLDRRHHHHRDVAEARVGGEGLQRLVAVHLGHLDVEQHQVDRGAARSASRACAPVLGERDRVAELLERAPEEQPVHPVVVDDQEVAGRRRYAGRSRRSSSSARATRSYARGEPARRGRSAPVQAPGAGHRLELPGQGREAERAEGLAGGLERVGGPAEGVDVRPGQGPSQRGDELPARPRRTCRSARRRTRRPSSRASRSNVRSIAGRSRRPGAGAAGARARGRLAGRAHRVRAPAALERGDQLLHPDRLRHVVVHAGRRAQLAVALHARWPSWRRSAAGARPASAG